MPSLDIERHDSTARFPRTIFTNSTTLRRHPYVEKCGRFTLIYQSILGDNKQKRLQCACRCPSINDNWINELKMIRFTIAMLRAMQRATTRTWLCVDGRPLSRDNRSDRQVCCELTQWTIITGMMSGFHSKINQNRLALAFRPFNSFLSQCLNQLYNSWFNCVDVEDKYKLCEIRRVFLSTGN